MRGNKLFTSYIVHGLLILILINNNLLLLIVGKGKDYIIII